MKPIILKSTRSVRARQRAISRWRRSRGRPRPRGSGSGGACASVYTVSPTSPPRNARASRCSGLIGDDRPAETRRSRTEAGLGVPQVDPARMGVARGGATAVPPRLRSAIPTRADRSCLRLRYSAPTGASPMATGDAATHAHPRGARPGARKYPRPGLGETAASKRNRPWPRVSPAPARIAQGGAFLRSPDARGGPPPACPKERLNRAARRPRSSRRALSGCETGPKGSRSVRVTALAGRPGLSSPVVAIVALPRTDLRAGRRQRRMPNRSHRLVSRGRAFRPSGGLPSRLLVSSSVPFGLTPSH